MSDKTVAPEARSVTVTWLRGLTFDAEARGHHVVMDALAGLGDDRGASPMELLLFGLAGCMGMDVVSILGKSHRPISDFRVTARGARSAEHPRRFTRIEVSFEVTADEIDRAAVDRAVGLSVERYCSVLGTLREAPEVVTAVVLRAASAAAGAAPAS